MARKKVSPVLKRPNGLLAEDVLDSDDDNSSCLSDVSVRSEECLESTGTDEKRSRCSELTRKISFGDVTKRCHLAITAALLCVAHVMIILR